MVQALADKTRGEEAGASMSHGFDDEPTRRASVAQVEQLKNATSNRSSQPNMTPPPPPQPKVEVDARTIETNAPSFDEAKTDLRPDKKGITPPAKQARDD